jgi:hypothetical protein
MGRKHIQLFEPARLHGSRTCGEHKKNHSRSGERLWRIFNRQCLFQKISS